MHIPMNPRIAMAIPTLRGGMPRPPVKWNGRCVGFGWAVLVDGVGETGVERNTNQRLLKVPRWVAIIEWAIRVHITL